MFKALVRGLWFRYEYSRDPIGKARKMGVTVGERCRLLCGPSAFGSEPYLVALGDHVTITSGVQFITHDGGVWVFRDKYPDIEVFGSIHVGSNVFIGYRSIIMPGVRIGDNVVVGAGAVVTRDIPANSVAVGVPAKVLRSIDDYWQAVSETSTDIRSLSESEKRQRILDYLNGGR